MIDRAQSVIAGLACLAALGCGPSAEQIRLQSQRDELKKEVAEQKQYNDDLRFRMKVVEARNKVLIDLVQGLTVDPEHFKPRHEKLASADSSLQALDRDVEALVTSVRHSRDDLDALRAQRKALQDELWQARRTIEDARVTQAEVDARFSTLRRILMPLMELVHGGRINVRMDYGQFAIQLPEGALFTRGETHLSAAGAQLFDRVALGLQTTPERKFRVVGPSEPSSKRGATQRQLTATRVLAVLDYLVSRGVPSASLIATTHAIAEPGFAPSGTERFFEIVLLPKAEELPVLPSTEQLLDTTGGKVEGAAASPSALPAVPEASAPPSAAVQTPSMPPSAAPDTARP